MTTSLTLNELGQLVKSGEIDTVVVVMTDMQGRLVGKRIHGSFFIDEIAHHIEGLKFVGFQEVQESLGLTPSRS